MVPLFAALAGPAFAADEPPARYRIQSDVVLADDGTYQQTLHREIAVANEAAARREAQQSLQFSDAVERLELVEAYTQKPDGRRIAVDPRAIRIQLAPGVANAPEYTDRKQMVAVFPDAHGGDRLVSTWRRTVTHPVVPGELAWVAFFNRTTAFDDVALTFTTPSDKPMQTEQHDVALEETRLQDGRHRYRFHYAAPVPLAEDPAAVSALERSPRLFASTFEDWTAFSRQLSPIFASKAEVTSKIQALADEVTAGTADKREQARLLYEWVSRHIRWVAIYLGNDGYIPHAAEMVLANGYGDCKDQATLLVALLHAKGIAAEPLLINLVNPLYELSGPAVFIFDHCITYLPDWDLYADTTPGGAPFGTVPFTEYGKPVIHLRAAGAPPDRVAPVAASVAGQTLRTTATLDAEGVVTGASVTDGSGPYATALRSAARGIEAQGAEQAAARQLRALGEPGQGSITVPPNDEMGSDYRLQGQFTLESHPEWLDGAAFQVPAGLRLLARTGDTLLGPLEMRNLPATEPSPCHAGRSEEELSLSLPPGFRPARLPKGAAVEGSFFRYESRYFFADGTLTVRRSLMSSFDQAFCAGPQREEAARALIAIRRDRDARISLERAEP